MSSDLSLCRHIKRNHSEHPFNKKIPAQGLPTTLKPGEVRSLDYSKDLLDKGIRRVAIKHKIEYIITLITL